MFKMKKLQKLDLYFVTPTNEKTEVASAVNGYCIIGYSCCFKIHLSNFYEADQFMARHFRSIYCGAAKSLRRMVLLAFLKNHYINYAVVENFPYFNRLKLCFTPIDFKVLQFLRLQLLVLYHCKVFSQTALMEVFETTIPFSGSYFSL